MGNSTSGRNVGVRNPGWEYLAVLLPRLTGDSKTQFHASDVFMMSANVQGGEQLHTHHSLAFVG